MSDWFHDLSEKRPSFVESARVNGFERGIASSVVHKYADPTNLSLNCFRTPRINQPGRSSSSSRPTV